jgi:hypothetical protein
MKFMPLWFILLCTVMSHEIFAAPTLTGAALCELRTLKVNTVNSSFPVEISTEEYSRKESSDVKNYAPVKPYDVIKWVEVSFYQITLALKESSPTENVFKRWFKSASWKDDDTEAAKQIGFASPKAVIILKDNGATKTEWILEVWDLGVRLSIAHTCGSNAYQLHPDSKRAFKFDKRFASELLELVVSSKKDGIAPVK